MLYYYYIYYYYFYYYYFLCSLIPKENLYFLSVSYWLFSISYLFLIGYLPGEP